MCSPSPLEAARIHLAQTLLQSGCSSPETCPPGYVHTSARALLSTAHWFLLEHGALRPTEALTQDSPDDEVAENAGIRKRLATEKRVVTVGNTLRAQVAPSVSSSRMLLEELLHAALHLIQMMARDSDLSWDDEQHRAFIETVIGLVVYALKVARPSGVYSAGQTYLLLSKHPLHSPHIADHLARALGVVHDSPPRRPTTTSPPDSTAKLFSAASITPSSSRSIPSAYVDMHPHRSCSMSIHTAANLISLLSKLCEAGRMFEGVGEAAEEPLHRDPHWRLASAAEKCILQYDTTADVARLAAPVASSSLTDGHLQLCGYYRVALRHLFEEEEWVCARLVCESALAAMQRILSLLQSEPKAHRSLVERPMLAGALARLMLRLLKGQQLARLSLVPTALAVHLLTSVRSLLCESIPLPAMHEASSCSSLERVSRLYLGLSAVRLVHLTFQRMDASEVARTNTSGQAALDSDEATMMDPSELPEAAPASHSELITSAAPSSQSALVEDVFVDLNLLFEHLPLSLDDDFDEQVDNVLELLSEQDSDLLYFMISLFDVYTICQRHRVRLWIAMKTECTQWIDMLLLRTNAPLHPLILFARFMQHIEQSVELLLDYLISPETAVNLLEYLLALCRLLIKPLEFCEQAAVRQPSHYVQFAVDTLGSLCRRLEALSSDQLPYNPTALIRHLNEVERCFIVNFKS